MKTFEVMAIEKIKRYVIVEADNYEEAIDAYYNGEYDKSEEVSFETLETDAKELK